MQALLADAQAAGAELALNSRLASGRLCVSGGASGSGSGGSSSGALPQPLHALTVADAATGETADITTRWLVNAAGLEAQAVARALAGLPRASVPPRFLAKGSYFSLAGVASPFSRLVYPLPEPGLGGLGVHATLDLGGQVKFGPDVEWVDEVSYEVDAARAGAFYPAVRSYWPGLPDGALAPSYAGVRPKVAGPGAPAADFVIQGAAGGGGGGGSDAPFGGHGVRGLVCLYGIESPGLTAALAIGDHVVRMLLGQEDEEQQTQQR